MGKRQDEIRALIRDQEEITLRQLEEMFPDVSTMTLRRDLIRLEEEGVLRRTRGGAVSLTGLTLLSEDAFYRRAKQRVAAKNSIADKALVLVEEGRSLYLDSGTTLMAFARALPDHRLNILTSGPGVAVELAGKKDVEVLLLGGRMDHMTLSVSGPEALHMLQSINIDMAFMSASGYTDEAGFTSGIRDECLIKQEVLRRARRKFMLMDSSKVGRALPYTFARIEDLHVLISDDDLPQDLANRARQAGVRIM
jgi:DeoR/GlpR family transcriptional regulator of sugar metabolism